MRKKGIYVLAVAVVLAVTTTQPMTAMASIGTYKCMNGGGIAVVGGQGINKKEILGKIKMECGDAGAWMYDTWTPEILRNPSALENSANPANPANPEEVTRQVVDLVNQERAKAGLAPLKMDGRVAGAAQVRAGEIESSFSHTRPDGSSFSTALAEAGVTYGTSGENIAYGQSSAQEVMDQWMDSAGHRANILNPVFTSVGVGHYEGGGTDYWVQLFVQ